MTEKIFNLAPLVNGLNYCYLGCNFYTLMLDHRKLIFSRETLNLVWLYKHFTLMRFSYKNRFCHLGTCQFADDDGLLSLMEVCNFRLVMAAILDNQDSTCPDVVWPFEWFYF